jgi:hypothetical protein
MLLNVSTKVSTEVTTIFRNVRSMVFEVEVQVEDDVG